MAAEEEGAGKMKISRMSVSNFTSFGKGGLTGTETEDEQGVVELGDFNLLIGPNNSGKSNVLRATSVPETVLRPADAAGDLWNITLDEAGAGCFRNWQYNHEAEREMTFSFTLELNREDFKLLGVESYDFVRNRADVVAFLFGLKKDWPKRVSMSGRIRSVDGAAVASLTRLAIPNDPQADQRNTMVFDRPRLEGLTLVKDDLTDRIVWRATRGRDDQGFAALIAPAREHIRQFLAKLANLLASAVLSIPATRSVEPAGDSLINLLFELSQGSATQIGLHDTLVEYIQRLLFAQDKNKIRLVYPGAAGKRALRIQVGRLQLPLSSYGSAVEQMLFMAAKIVCSCEGKVWLMEEPESHLHPGLQREFVRFLREIQPQLRNQYVMASHSTVFLNEFARSDGRVFTVERCVRDSEPPCSIVRQLEPCSTAALFTSLGVKPSDLLFADGLLIVEGPIDKDVYRHWARKLGKPFEHANVLVIDAEGAGNIAKYLGSEVIQRTCLASSAVCDKNAEKDLRRKLAGIVPPERIRVLSMGDLEDYYPRRLVKEFVQDQLAVRASKTTIPTAAQPPIEVGNTVSQLDAILGKDRWKRRLADRILSDMEADEIHDEVRAILTELRDQACS